MSEEALDHEINTKIKKEVQADRQTFGIELLVAKIDTKEQHKKFRAYPWRDLGSFIASKKIRDGEKYVPLCDVGSAQLLEMLFQVQLFTLLNTFEATNLVVLDHLPNDDHQARFVPVTPERFLELIHGHLPKHHYELTQSILSLQLISNIVPGMSLYIMLRPFVFLQEVSDRPYYAGSLLIRTNKNTRGWFHQFKWRF